MDMQNELELLRRQLSEALERLARLEKENHQLKEENERLKRILGNNSSNSSLPPSTDQKGKPANTYNSRGKNGKSGKKAGAQSGHKGKHLSKDFVEQKIKDGSFVHRVEDVGDISRPYVSRYVLDIEVRTVAREIRIHADESGKFNVPPELGAEVSYGDELRAIAVTLYGVGIMSNDSICEFLNAVSGDSLAISTGSVYGFLHDFAEKAENECQTIEQHLGEESVLCTDGTTITTNGKQTYIRNFSSDEYVLYKSSDKKNLADLHKMDLLEHTKATLMHDHETALYHFGSNHGECNVHVVRYLRKSEEETKNPWCRQMIDLLHEMNVTRKDVQMKGDCAFSVEQVAQFEQRYDQILEEGREQNRNTQGYYARKAEVRLLNRMEKYKINHLLFIHDFSVPFSNNMSERDLRVCKKRDKLSGGFRTAGGRDMFCTTMSFLETLKRQGKNVFRNIVAVLSGTPVLA